MNRNEIINAAQKANAYKSSFDWYAFDEEELVRFIKHCIDISITSDNRKPLTEESLENLFLGNDSNDWWRLELKEFVNVARAIERAHGIGGEE